MRDLKRLAILLLLIAACARMGAPPGGPPRLIPPKLLGVYPDSGTAPCDFRGVAEFRFDEVTSEGANPNFGTGGGDLERLILFSPDSAVPVVEWHRDRITVRPRRGWHPNRTYRVELLPGVADLRLNIMKQGQTIAFTTCGPPPKRVLAGRAVDWMTARAVPFALIEAIHLPDSARYRSLADSTGRFRITQLPDGPYLVIATLDQSRDHVRDPFKEPWDSITVPATRDTTGEIWAFPRDTLPPTIREIARQDSVSIAVTFARPLDPLLRLDSSSVRVRVLIGSDSVSIGTLFAVPKPVYDSIQKLLAPPPAPKPDSSARTDSSRTDTASRAVVAQPPKRPAPAAPTDTLAQKRPALTTVLVIRTRGHVELGTRYVVNVSDVRQLGGRTGPPVVRVLSTPKPPSAADSVKSKADSAKKAKADSTRTDSLRRAGKPAGGGRFFPQ